MPSTIFKLTSERSVFSLLAVVKYYRPDHDPFVDDAQDLRRLDLPPAVLLSSKPSSDPLESILYATSVGVPSVVYETVCPFAWPYDWKNTFSSH